MARRGGFPGGAMPGNMNNLMKQAQRMQKQMEERAKDINGEPNPFLAQNLDRLLHFVLLKLLHTERLCDLNLYVLFGNLVLVHDCLKLLREIFLHEVDS